MQLSWSSIRKQLRSMNRCDDARRQPLSQHVVSRLAGCGNNTNVNCTLCFQVGTHAMDSTLLKYSAKDHFFKAALCHFCVDMLNAKVSQTTELVSVYSNCYMSHCPNIHLLVPQLAVQKYEEMFPAFSDSRECKLVKVRLGVVFLALKQKRKLWIIFEPRKGEADGRQLNSTDCRVYNWVTVAFLLLFSIKKDLL